MKINRGTQHVSLVRTRRKKYEGKPRWGARTDEARKLMKVREGMKFREVGVQEEKKSFFFATSVRTYPFGGHAHTLCIDKQSLS